jgi:cytidyltransferase-like protein
MFKFAKSQCDHLTVGIDSDSRVKELKGSTRPFNSHEDRKEMLLALGDVDDVFIFDSSQELIDLIKTVSPDIMIVGSDYKDREIIGAEYARQLFFFERIRGYSTSQVTQGIGNR